MGRNYKYSLRTGVVYRKIINVKKTIFGVVATASLVGAMAVPALADSPVVSDSANPNACFGQARASYAQGGPNSVLLSPHNNGYYISQRKGDNPANNAAYIETYCQQ
ncbi:MAG TPA: hypothetical protein VLG13_02215 [Patescibacteria group bacterium]|nr:hypothetical protein [Patescibacteria group bacterium]